MKICFSIILVQMVYPNAGADMIICFWSGRPGFNCWTSFAPAFQIWFAVEYSSCFISVMNLDLYVRCFDSLMTRCSSRGPNNFYVYMNHNRTQEEVARA